MRYTSAPRPGVYRTSRRLAGRGLTAATPVGGYWFIFLYITRIIAGAGIGGEYSAIDEMIPARYRGRVRWVQPELEAS